MKRICLFIVFVLVCQSSLAQFPYYGHNDREKINLKGKVASVAEYFCVVKEAFGEWENGGRVLSRYSVFDTDGNFILDTQESMPFKKSKTDYIQGIGTIPVPGLIQWYHKNELSGKITNIRRFTSSSQLMDLIDIGTWLSKASSEEEIQYDYNDNGSLKSVTLKEEDRISRKDIYKYNDNGYEIWFYGYDGKRDTALSFCRTGACSNRERRGSGPCSECSVSVVAGVVRQAWGH